LDCASFPAIQAESRTPEVVFVAMNGCIDIESNSVVAGVLGRKVHISANSDIEYDPSLSQAILGSDLGGWRVVSVKEY